MSRKEIKIGDRLVGEGHPPYIIAEISGNHNRDIERAYAIIAAAKEAGADAVKLQTYTADTLTIESDKPDFRIDGGLWDGRTLHELYREAYTPWDWHERLFARAEDLRISIFSTPFDFTAVDFLENLNPPAYKIASFELIDLPLVERVAKTGKPIILSTGMADLEEIEEAVATAHGAGCENLIVLHCISGYPTPIGDANLRTLADLRDRFGCVTGLSDHTLGTAAAIASVALGGAVIEKHFTLARDDGGPDAAFSLEPNELKGLVGASRSAWEALGQVNYSLKESEKGNVIFRRSLYAVEDLKAGDSISAKNVRSIRPGYGLPPKHLPELIGRKAARDIERGTPLDWSLVE